MLEDREAQSVVEYIVVVAIFVLLAAPVLYALYLSIGTKLLQNNLQIGS